MARPGAPYLHKASSSFREGLDLVSSLVISPDSKASKSSARAGCVVDTVVAVMENAAAAAIFLRRDLRSIIFLVSFPSGAFDRLDWIRLLLPMFVLEKPTHDCKLSRETTAEAAKVLNLVMMMGSVCCVCLFDYVC
eukprot:CAMPEP_0201621486 /NCGR_PEP_ID=MMETSP0492-20130828/46906_1 /ASSEMBLY_ACC=CAM_ASM_000837 /TAXON_ID=420259 /ORGANISM="Thalassiosira gravida, Strain GMp14c1" /LENGTH=135 /DNA_ID=CAMNT_0048091027 /DNA_START=679 /DNA_END=1086 /DNA_ORIENTATION=+